MKSTSTAPNDNVTRAQMASFIARALGLPASSTDHFSDDDGVGHEANINKLADAGISLGCGGDNFCPNDWVTRGQMASFMARAFNLPGGAPDYFTDDNNSSHETNINKIAHDGITLGCGNNRYCPDTFVPRSQMASFLGRGLDLEPNNPPYPTRTLMERFYEYDPTRSGAKRFDVDGVYMPRQFSAGIDIDLDSDDTWAITSAGQYQGWDVFIPEREWSNSTSNEYLNISLTRPTRVAIAWVARWDDVPNWLRNNWELSGTIGVDNEVANVYERTLGYGENWLPGPSSDGDYSRMYIVLMAETDGEPTAAPPVPAGKTTPVPNDLCPQWVHDELYLVEAPDGEMYGSWHPQIDPTYWCHFGHEHGSNPALIPGKPKVPYQYVAAKVATERARHRVQGVHLPDADRRVGAVHRSRGHVVRTPGVCTAAHGLRDGLLGQRNGVVQDGLQGRLRRVRVDRRWPHQLDRLRIQHGRPRRGDVVLQADQDERRLERLRTLGRTRDRRGSQPRHGVRS